MRSILLVKKIKNKFYDGYNLFFKKKNNFFDMRLLIKAKAHSSQTTKVASKNNKQPDLNSLKFK